MFKGIKRINGISLRPIIGPIAKMNLKTPRVFSFFLQKGSSCQVLCSLVKADVVWKCFLILFFFFHAFFPKMSFGQQRCSAMNWILSYFRCFFAGL